MKLKCLQLCVAGLFLSLVSFGSAFGYSTVVTFGDSLSDNGNIPNEDGGYFRFTDGTLWVESLANKFSATLNDHAFGGATTGYDNPAIGSPYTGLRWQVDTFGPSLGLFPSSNTIITLWAGANDLLQSRSPIEAVANIEKALDGLYNNGGRNFLIPNLPDIGKTPAFVLGDPANAPAASEWTVAFNTTLDGLLCYFDSQHADVNLFFVDTFTIFEQFEVGSDEWLALFWGDGFHPSSVGHNLIYEAALAAVEPVPEPATLLLFATGLTALAAARQRRRNKMK